ncbi:MAG: adenylyl cyclase, partial [Chloroflexi bacterium]
SGTGTNFGCFALNNFWRSLSNLTINVTKSQNPVYVPAPPDPGGPFCEQSNEIWAVSQASPMRRVAINGFTTFMDYCGPKAYASGGFVADSKLNGVLNGSQQQWITRNSKIDFWTNAVWNQVFSGVIGAPAQSFPSPTYTTLPASPVTREAPYLYLDSAGNYNVFVPSVQYNTAGTSWASGQTPGTSISIDTFFVAQPTDSAASINAALQRGMNLILTPGVYHLDQSINVTRPDSVVLGLGFPTLVPDNGVASMTVARAKGMLISGIIFDAGPTNSPVLLQVGSGHARSDNEASDPTALHDVFFRIGGATPGKATTALVVNSDNVILDDIWSWRADHGNGVGWTANTADTGLLVNGDNVTAYGLFVEHYQKYNVIWNGNGGMDIFFQNELPYDVPNQAAWMEAPGVDGYAAFKVGSNVTSFHGYGMGSYSFFNQGVNIYAAHAFEVPTTLAAGSLRDLLTIFLDPVNGSGGILHVVNDTGGSSTIANPDTPVTVVSYP